MDRRHLAVFGLLGWYLMIPPHSASNQYDDRAPLSHWFVYSSHDTAHECEGAKFLNREGNKDSGNAMHHAFEQAQCIASDDPRLGK